VVGGFVNDELAESLDGIKVYPVGVNSEEDLANEIARVANLTMVLGHRLEGGNRGCKEGRGSSVDGAEGGMV
jgi:hypothetical protein